MSLHDTLDSLWQVVVFGLLLGAGVPAVFALGLHLMFGGTLGVEEDGTPAAAEPTLGRRLGAYLCFGVVIAAVVAGIAAIIITGGS